jgi:hypothetical protein
MQDDAKKNKITAGIRTLHVSSCRGCNVAFIPSVISCQGCDAASLPSAIVVAVLRPRSSRSWSRARSSRSRARSSSLRSTARSSRSRSRATSLKSRSRSPPWGWGRGHHLEAEVGEGQVGEVEGGVVIRDEDLIWGDGFLIWGRGRL